MKSYWQSYQSNLHKKNGALSIANDELEMLMQKLAFFLPSQQALLRSFYLPIYGALWGLLMALVRLAHDIQISHMAFLSTLFIDMLLLSLIAYIGLFVYESIRPMLFNLHHLVACVWVTVIFSLSALLVGLLAHVALPLLLYGHVADVFYALVNILIEIIITTGITILFLLYYLKRHQDLMMLQKMFDIEVAMQNDQIKARIAPHFLFNTINGLVSLVETNPDKAIIMLGNVSELFRVSFSKFKEIGMDTEIHVCKVFLEIDDMRFQNKLKVKWHLPDEDTLYDMTICGMTLQSVIEKLLNQVVEHTVEEIELIISMTWQNHKVNIDVSLQLPKDLLMMRHDLLDRLDFSIQERKLQVFFGNQASIITNIHDNHIVTNIQYCLFDTAVDNDVCKTWQME